MYRNKRSRLGTAKESKQSVYFLLAKAIIATVLDSLAIFLVTSGSMFCRTKKNILGLGDNCKSGEITIFLVATTG